MPPRRAPPNRTGPPRPNHPGPPGGRAAPVPTEQPPSHPASRTRRATVGSAPTGSAAPAARPTAGPAERPAGARASSTTAVAARRHRRSAGRSRSARNVVRYHSLLRTPKMPGDGATPDAGPDLARTATRSRWITPRFALCAKLTEQAAEYQCSISRSAGSDRPVWPRPTPRRRHGPRPGIRLGAARPTRPRNGRRTCNAARRACPAESPTTRHRK
jgi:hypothetical protein